MTQSSLWQEHQQSNEYAELCNALYERELSLLASMDNLSIQTLQGRLKSLPYYVQKAAHQMVGAESPLTLDCQNATWSTKQSKAIPLAGQAPEQVWDWYQSQPIETGLVVPVLVSEQVVIDCIDKVDNDNQRFRTNVFGWFDVTTVVTERRQLLKPTKKVMMAGCAGHRWRDDKVITPKIPSLRELLLSCSINWHNFHRPLMNTQ